MSFSGIENRLVDLLCAACHEAQRNLCERVELYRQHLWMLSGGSGETSSLTPSSFLCATLEGSKRDTTMHSIASHMNLSLFQTMEDEPDIADPFLVLYMRIERDLPQIADLYDMTNDPAADKAWREMSMLFPLLPCLSCWRMKSFRISLVMHNWA